MIYILIVISIIYIATIGLLVYGFDKIKTIKTIYLEPKTRFSIIVAFRNEEDNFKDLLNSISNLSYPKKMFEIVVVNDDSNDKSVIIFDKWQVDNPDIQSRLLQNIRTSNSPKKDAISTAIVQIQNDWIITTDADCVVNKNWLWAFDNFIQKTKVEMIAGAVSISCSNKLLNYFQFVDLLSLQGATIGSFGINKPFMCNGANFAYTKMLFLELNGFDGNDKFASGDDVFLLQKAVKLFPEKVAYLKHLTAIVETKPEVSWAKLFQQRVRWASKTGNYNGFFGKFLAVVVFAMNLALLLCVLLVLFGSSISTGLVETIALSFTSKFIVDYFLIFKTNKFIEKDKIIFPIVSSLFYPIFCVAVAFYSFFGRFEWKNRKF